MCRYSCVASGPGSPGPLALPDAGMCGKVSPRRSSRAVPAKASPARRSGGGGLVPGLLVENSDGFDSGADGLFDADLGDDGGIVIGQTDGGEDFAGADAADAGDDEQGGGFHRG